MASIRPRTWHDRAGEERRAYLVDWRDETGRRRARQFRRLKDATAFRRELLAGRIDGPGLAEDTSLEAAARAWLEACRRGLDGRVPIAAATDALYSWAVERWIVPELGRLALAELDEPRLAAFRDQLLEGRLSRVSAAKVLKALKAILEEARRKRWIGADTWSAVRIRGAGAAARARAIQVPRPAEVRHLLEIAEGLRRDPDGRRRAAWQRFYPLIASAALTGLRQGEIRGLAWHDIDFARRVITVRRAADFRGALGAPKSDAGLREVELPEPLARLLEEWRQVAPPVELVFATRSGRALSKENLYHRAWRTLIERAELPGLRFHALRHFYASSLIAKGATAAELKRALGHASIDVTFDTYGHLFPEDRAARRARIDALAAELL